MLKPVISCLQSWGRVMCSCGSLSWHGDPSSTRGTLRWCIGCMSRYWQLGWPLWEEARPTGWAPASQPRSAHHMWTETGWSSSKRNWPLCPEPSPPGSRTPTAVGSSLPFLLFPSTDLTRTTLPHPGLQHVAWTFHHKDIPTHYRKGPYALTGPTYHRIIGS